MEEEIRESRRAALTGERLTLPPDVLSRLRKAEASQRRQTLARDLFAERVDVAGLWERQRGLCGCGCGLPLSVDIKWDAALLKVEPSPLAGYPVIAHRLARGSKGEHSRENVELWRWQCNREAGLRETSEAASVKRFAPVKGRKRKGRIVSRGFAKPPPGHKYRWGSRPLRSK